VHQSIYQLSVGKGWRYNTYLQIQSSLVQLRPPCQQMTAIYTGQEWVFQASGAERAPAKIIQHQLLCNNRNDDCLHHCQLQAHGHYSVLIRWLILESHCTVRTMPTKTLSAISSLVVLPYTIWHCSTISTIPPLIPNQSSPSTAFSLFNFSCFKCPLTTSFQVLFGLLLGHACML